MNQYLVSQLKQGRLNKELKQSDVTEITGIKNTTLSNYENGVTEPDIDTFLSLCELYELDFVSILEEAYGITIPGNDFSIKPSEIEIIKQYRELDTHGRKMVDFTIQEEWERSTSTNVIKDNVVPYSSPVQAARNDYIDEPGELEKTIDDINSLKRPE